MNHLPPVVALLTLAFAFLAATTARADDAKNIVAPEISTTTPVAQEFSAQTSYSGRSEIKQGSASLGGVSNIHSSADYVVSPQITDGVLLRLGGSWDRNSFGLPAAVPLPNTLQETNLIIGADFAVTDKILLRAEAHPGLYSDFVNITSSDFDCPVQVGGTYLYSKNLQFILGLQIDLRSAIPVIGAPGVRWQFADQWVLSAIPPKPQLQYLFSKTLTLYAGAEISGGTYHLNDSFGDNHGHSADSGNTPFNNRIVDFTEVHTGVGLTWKFLPNLSLDVSAGYMPYRTFEIHSDQISFDTHSQDFHNNLGSGSYYTNLGISGSF